MLRLMVGFVLGITLSAVIAQTAPGHDPKNSMIDDTLNTMKVIALSGVGPDGNMAPIKVDGSGHVICSTEHQ